MNRLAVVLLAVVVLFGCSESTPPSGGTQTPAKEAEKKPDAITGRVAFQKMFPSARLWAADAQPFRVVSETLKDHTGKDGKAAVWRASFASPSRGNIKLFTWSGVKEEGAPEQGVSAGTEDTYNPRNSATQTFDIAFWKVDSDKVFATAQEHGGAKLLKATPDMPIFYLLDWSPKSNQLVWHAMYGGTGLDVRLRVAVDASTGNFLRIEK